MSFFTAIQHLLPDAAAWRTVVNTTLRKFFVGLAAGVPQSARDFVDDVWADAFPSTTRELAQWEAQFGLETNPVEATRRLNLAAEWAATGGQSPSYIQGVLQTAGFDVYIHEWWNPPGPPYVARDPRLYTTPPRTGSYRCKIAGTPQAKCRPKTYQTQARLTSFLANWTGYLVNLDLTDRAPPPVPSDPTKWPYFLYIAGETFPNEAVVPLERRAEFERLLLKICPAQQWIVTLVYYSDEDTVIASHTSSGAAYQTVSALTYTIPEGYSVTVMFEAIGVAGSEHGTYVKQAKYTRLVGGSAIENWNMDIGGSPSEIPDPVWDAKIVLTGNNLEFQVRANNDNPNWTLERVVTIKALP